MKIILFSHGDFANAAKGAVKLITGNVDNMYSFGVYENSVLNDLEKKIEDIIKEHYKEHTIVILCDIVGGTPFNISYKLLTKYPDTICFTGFNIPILLELSLSTEESRESIEDLIRITYKNGVNKIDLREDFKIENPNEIEL